jgi:hypothetical protein
MRQPTKDELSKGPTFTTVRVVKGSAGTYRVQTMAWLDEIRFVVRKDKAQSFETAPNLDAAVALAIAKAGN